MLDPKRFDDDDVRSLSFGFLLFHIEIL